MGPIWVLSAPDGPHVGPMNLAIRGMIQILPETVSLAEYMSDTCAWQTACCHLLCRIELLTNFMSPFRDAYHKSNKFHHMWVFTSKTSYSYSFHLPSPDNGKYMDKIVWEPTVTKIVCATLICILPSQYLLQSMSQELCTQFMFYCYLLCEIPVNFANILQAYSVGTVKSFVPVKSCCLMPSYKLNQCWHIVNSTLRNKLQ